MDETTKVLVATVRHQLAELNTNLRTLCLDHKVETEASMQTRSITNGAAQRIIDLEFRAVL